MTGVSLPVIEHREMCSHLNTQVLGSAEQSWLGGLEKEMIKTTMTISLHSAWHRLSGRVTSKHS